MELYRGTTSQKKPQGSFTHLGSLMAACMRLESLFISRNIHGFDGEKFILFTNTGERIGTKQPHEIYNEFIDFAKNSRIQAYTPHFKKALKLRDCWEDDPIGSGGLQIFENFDNLSNRERAELKALFNPFGHNILYPDVIQTLLRPSDVKSIFAQNRGNKFFQSEYMQRRERSEIRGEPWPMVEPYEIVWIDLSLKLRTWALVNGYSHFEYINTGEDNGHTSYVILQPDSVGVPTKTLNFDTQKLKDLAAPQYFSHLKAAWEKSRHAPGHSEVVNRQIDTLWCGFNPTQFVI